MASKTLPHAGPAEPATCLMPVTLHEQILSPSPVDVEIAAPARTTGMSESGPAVTGAAADSSTFEPTEVNDGSSGWAVCETETGRQTVDGPASMSDQDFAAFDGDVQSVTCFTALNTKTSALPAGTSLRRGRRAGTKAVTEMEDEIISKGRALVQRLYAQRLEDRGKGGQVQQLSKESELAVQTELAAFQRMVSRACA